MAADETKALGPEMDPFLTSLHGSAQDGSMVVAVAGPYTKEVSYKHLIRQDSQLPRQPK